MNEPLTPFHIAVQVRDIAEARHFYKELLGCSEGRSDAHWVDFNLYGHQLVCHLNPTLGVNGKLTPTSTRSMGKECRCRITAWCFGPPWAELAERLQRHGVDFLVKPSIRFKGQAGEQSTMFLFDPSGNALEFKSFRDIAAQLFATR